MDDKKLPRFEVIGEHQILDVDPGGIVELDPDRFNIQVLLDAGHIRPVDETPPAKAPKG